MNRLTLICAALALTTFPITAFAGNDDEILIGTQGARLGGAVTATVTDSTALWYNPGAIGRTRWAQFGASGTLVRGRMDTVDGDHDLTLSVVPSTLGHEIPLPGNWAFGYGIFTSQASPSSYDSGRFTYNFGAGLGAPLGPTLRVGLGVFAVYETRPVLKALSSFASLGLHWQPASAWNFGLSVNSPRMLLASSDAGSSANLDPGLSASAPLRVRAGVAHDFGRLILSLDGDVQPALRNTDAAIDRRLVPNGRIGLDYELDEQTRLGLGFFTDLSATRDPTLRQHFYGVSGGVETASHYNLDANEPAESIELSAFIGFRYAYGDGDVITTHELGVNFGSGLRF